MSYLRKVELWKPVHRRLNKREAWRRVRATRVASSCSAIEKLYPLKGSYCTNCGKNVLAEALENSGIIGKLLQVAKGTFIGVTPHTNLTCKGGAKPVTKRLNE